MKQLLFLIILSPTLLLGQSNNFKNDSISNSKEVKIGKEKRKFSLGYNFELITVKRSSYYSHSVPQRRFHEHHWFFQTSHVRQTLLPGDRGI